MRRIVPALIATLAGVVLLLNFHTAAGVKLRTVAGPTATSTPASGSSPPPSGPGATSPATTLPAGSRQLDGAVIQTQFGDVQVRVILNGGKITDVKPLQMPFDHQRSLEISQAVIPLLHDEVLQAQNAQINLLSGATYTSDAYQRSLQAALDQVKR